MAKIVKIPAADIEQKSDRPMVENLLNTLKDIDKDILDHLQSQQSKSTNHDESSDGKQ